ncbi:CRISPR-associated endonuclease Cas1 [Nostoc sp. 'Peltigera membranacea cyanobiont' 213]|uniref:CRISPR-associated endonuclease Cas1 n=1 Tax=Nostoc sp. 'Peltigera membranacea cyanobiont' 213 TaxID=2014530 RepID=UPI000B952143|nr:CRISPR-associated endonuclease Cas1 [Nostoc sp. 'Peltigera membranacea cyanobiont' 213]OYD87591.1 CRISPR-associated endonuclease Cas1 [Nostoc sp. 'Peltigera membranacea cyanobiont' 213]
MSTIYITDKDALIKTQHTYLKVFHQQQQLISIRLSNVSQLIIFDNINLPTNIIKTLQLHHIPVLYLTQNGEIIGRLENTSQLKAKYLTYQRQRRRDREFNRATAESIIWAKLHNQHTFLQSWTHHQANYATQRALNYLTLLMDNLPIAVSLDELREYSEEADKIYHFAIASLLNLSNPCPQTTAKHISGLLNLGNQLLHQYIYTLLITTGLHPDYAILHSNADYELPLAWDFTAEFRAPIVDDLVLNFARNHLNSNSNGNGNGKKPHTILQSFLQHWEAKLRTFVLHPYAGEVSYRQCLDLQVREYLATLLGDVEYYRPLALKFRPANSDFTNTIEPQTVSLKLVKR